MPWRIYWVRSAGWRFVFDSKISQNQMAKFIDCTGNLLFGAFELLKSWVSSDFPNNTGDFPQEEYKFGDVTKKAMNKAMDAIAGFTGKEDGALWTTRDTGPRTFE